MTTQENPIFVGELSRLLNVSRQKARRLMDNGDIPSLRDAAGNRYTTIEAIDEYSRNQMKERKSQSGKIANLTLRIEKLEQIVSDLWQKVESLSD